MVALFDCVIFIPVRANTLLSLFRKYSELVKVTLENIRVVVVQEHGLPRQLVAAPQHIISNDRTGLVSRRRLYVSDTYMVLSR